MSFDHSRETLVRALEARGTVLRGDKFKCIAHDDNNASAGIFADTGGNWRWKCQACGAGGDAADVEKINGTGKAPAAKQPSKIVEVYPYRDETGVLLLEKVRFIPKDFRQRRSDGKGGFIWNLNGVRRVLYRLPELIAATLETIIYIPEGEKDVHTIVAAGGVATCNFDGASKDNQRPKWLAEYNEFFRSRIVCIIADKDDAGRAHAANIAKNLSGVAADVRVLEVPGNACKDVSDYFSAGGTLEDLFQLWEQAPEWRPADGGTVDAAPEDPPHVDDEDPELVPLTALNLPEIPTDVLPSFARDFVLSLSAAKETPITMAALLTLAAIASTVQRVYRVRIEPAYHEALCIYSCPAMESGERKTAIYQPILRPLFDLQKQMRAEVQADIDRAKISRGLAESELKTLRRRFFSEKDSSARAALQKEIEDKTAALPTIPSLPQLVSEDSTEAALAVTLANNQESQLVGSDEGGFFDNLVGRFADVSELDLFLKGHTQSPHTVNRIGRENLYLHRPSLSIALSPQPHVLKTMGNMDGFINRGGMARFLVALPQSVVGSRQLLPAVVPDEVRREYADRLTALARAGRAFAEDEPRTLTLSADAYDAWKGFERSIEPRMGKGADLYGVKPWASKLAGAVARIAAVCHAADYGDSAAVYPIPADRMKAAIELGEALIPHAMAIHRLMGGGGHNVALAVVEHYDASGWPVGVQTLTDWWRPVRSIVGETSKLFEPVARQLVDHAYLIPVDPPARGGKRGQHFRRNGRLSESPKVL